jgi:hypothetical protein
MIGNIVCQSRKPFPFSHSTLIFFFFFFFFFFDRDLAFGIWQRSGSNDELPDLQPMSHGRIMFYFPRSMPIFAPGPCYIQQFHMTDDWMNMLNQNPRFVSFLYISSLLSFFLQSL